MGTPEHNFALSNSFELFALRGGGEQITKFSGHANQSCRLTCMVNSLSACCDTGNEYGVVIPCANWLCKLVVESCTSAPGGLQECSWSSSSSFFTLGFGTWGVRPRVSGYVACPHTLPHVHTPATSLCLCTRPDPLLCIQTPATCPHTLPPPMPHVPTPCHMPPH